MKKFSKSGPPARAERSERPARKFAGSATGPKRAYAPRDGDAPKRAYAPRDGAAPKRAYAPRDGAAPKRAYAPRDGDAPKRSYAKRDTTDAPRRPYTPRAPSDVGGGDQAAPRSAYADPYKPASRPPRDDDAGEGARRPAGRGFTVTLDPDVARVFRGDASVNKALRLVLQLMQVVEGPAPRGDRPGPRARTGYQGSDEARGFSRKPRFVEDDSSSDE